MRGQRKKEKGWSVTVEKGPKELRGVNINVRGPVVVGRSPGADIVMALATFPHVTRALSHGTKPFHRRLGFNKWNAVNGVYITDPTPLKNGDKVIVGDVTMRVRFA